MYNTSVKVSPLWMLIFSQPNSWKMKTVIKKNGRNTAFILACDASNTVLSRQENQ